MEYSRKFRRILVAECLLLLAGTVVFLLFAGRDQTLAFAAGGFVSLSSLVILGKAIEVVGGGRWGWLPGVAFIGRFVLYAWVLSAIIKVYPKLSNELASGLFLSVPAVLVEAIHDSFYPS